MDRKRKPLLSKLVSDNLKHTMYLHMYVRVTLTDDKVLEGWVKCVDPLTGVLVIFTLSSRNSSFEVKEVNFIRKSYILRVDVLKETNPEEKSFLSKIYVPKTAIVDEDRRDRLFAYIKAQRLPVAVSEDGRNITVTGCVIHPPYIDESCMGSNVRAVFSIGNLIQKFDSLNVEDKKMDVPICEEAVDNESFSSSDESSFDELLKPASGSQSSGSEESHEVISDNEELY